MLLVVKASDVECLIAGEGIGAGFEQYLVSVKAHVAVDSVVEHELDWRVVRALWVRDVVVVRPAGKGVLFTRTANPSAEHHEAKRPLRRPGKVEAGLRRRDRVGDAERVRVGVVAGSTGYAIGSENPDGWRDPIGEGEGELSTFLQRRNVGRQCVYVQHDPVRVHEVAVYLGDPIQVSFSLRC